MTSPLALASVVAIAPGTVTLLLWIVLIVVFLLLLGLIAYLLWRNKHPAKVAETKPDEEPLNGSASADLAEMSGSFRVALSTIRSRVEGRDFRYRVPWFLLVGPEGSGKSSLLSESSLSSSLEEQVGLQHAMGLAWNFFGEGVVIEIGGWCLNNGGATAALWRRLLRLFVKHRPERPLDGILLTLSAADLFGPKALSPAELVQRGTLIGERLRQLTQALGFHLPIYLILTQCDALTGFAEFSNELQPEELEQIFGWSNPFDDHLQFQPEWVDQAINTMRVTVERVQTRLYAMYDPSSTREAMFLFPGALHALMQPLRLLLSRAMRGGVDTPAPLLRGIYCCGSTDIGRTRTEREPALVPVARPDYGQIPVTDLQHRQEAQGWLTDAALEPWLRTRLQIGFTHDLFFRKIFIERNLGVPLVRFFSARDRLRLSIQIASAALAVFLSIGTAFAFHRLSHDANHLSLLLTTVDQELQTPMQVLQEGQADRHAGASDLIDAMATFQSGGFRSIFLPASWFSGLPLEIRSTMVNAFRQLVLERFHDGLAIRAQQIADLRRSPLNRTELPLPAPNDPPVTELQRLPAYLQMRAFLSRVYELDRHIAMYNRMCQLHSNEPLQSVVALDGYLHNHPEPPASQAVSNPYFQIAVDDASYQPFSYQPELQAQVTAKAQMLIAQLDDAWIEHSPIRTATDKVVADLDILDTPQPETLTGLTSISNDMRQAQTLYGSPDLAWPGAPQPTIPSDLAAVTTGIAASSPFFQSSLADWIQTTHAEHLGQLEVALSQAQSPVTGAVLDNSNGRWMFSLGSSQVQAALSGLLKTSFVSDGTDTLEPEVLQRSTHIVWDKSILDTTAAMPAAYGKFVTEQLANSLPTVRGAMTRVGAEALSLTVEGAFFSAAHPSHALDSALADAQAFNDAAPSLSALLDSLSQYGLTEPATQIRDISVRQASTVLSQLNADLDERQPYGVPSAAFANWTDGPPTAELFNAATSDALASFIATQYDEISSLNTSAQPAVRFLDANHATASLHSRALFSRWKAIGSALDAYAAKKPGNSVQTLDDLIATGADKIVPANGCASPHAIAASRPDYFLLAAAQLQHSLVLRCDELLTQSFDSAYGQLANTFNHGLAGRFPFAADDASALSEAGPAAIAEVYRLRDSAADLFHSPREATAPPPVRGFLTVLDNARPWFTSLLSTASSNNLVLEVQPEFRADRDRELGGNQIIDWSVQIGETTLHLGDAPAKLQWTLGDPVILSLRWARNAPFVPAKASPANSANGALNSDGETVTWRFTDTWSLLRAMRVLAPDAAASGFHLGEPFTLALNIPEVPASTTAANMQAQPITAARVYLRFVVTPPGSKDPITTGHLPTDAPPLHPRTAGSTTATAATKETP
jgi:type VI secretion system protein ImpL